VTLVLNALDRRGEGLAGIYASVLGVSAESADSGEVAAEPCEWLISVCRPGGSEAAAGKNPVGHTGKIYSVLADRLAGRLVGGVPGLEEVTLWFSSEIGRPVDRRVWCLHWCISRQGRRWRTWPRIGGDESRGAGSAAGLLRDVAADVTRWSSGSRHESRDE